MEGISILEWALSGAGAVALAAVGHILVRVSEIERQILEIAKGIRDEHDKSLAELWAARDRDRDLREKDQEAMLAFRTYVLTHLATKQDFDALETRLTGAVRMIVNERVRRGDGDARI